MIKLLLVFRHHSLHQRDYVKSVTWLKCKILITCIKPSSHISQAFWSEDDSLDGSTEDSDDHSSSKYTVPTLELVRGRYRPAFTCVAAMSFIALVLCDTFYVIWCSQVPRRARRRRITSPKAIVSRPPTRQHTAFPVDLDIASALPEPRPLSRQEISVSAYSHKDKHTVRACWRSQLLLMMTLTLYLFCADSQSSWTSFRQR